MDLVQAEMDSGSNKSPVIQREKFNLIPATNQVSAYAIEGKLLLKNVTELVKRTN